MSEIVVYDACVLYPAPLRDILLRMATANLVSPRWTEEILNECFRTILQNRADLQPEALDRTRQLMNEAVPDSIVSDYEHLIEELHLPDENDRHVVAAAIECGARAIITANTRDFPQEILCSYELTALHPDSFVLRYINEYPHLMCSIIYDQANALRSPPRSALDVIDMLEKVGLTESAARFRVLIDG